MTEVDIAKLAALARIDVPESEQRALAEEIPAILAFVEQVATVADADTKHTGDHYNIFRDDTDPHESGIYTQELLDAAPSTKEGYVAVRKIISQD